MFWAWKRSAGVPATRLVKAVKRASLSAAASRAVRLCSRLAAGMDALGPLADGGEQAGLLIGVLVEDESFLDREVPHQTPSHR